MGKLPDFRRYSSIVDLVDDWAGQKAGTVIYAVEREHVVETWTGQDLIRRSRMAAFRLHAAGVRAGDRALTLAHNSAELGAAYVALWRLRAVPVPLDHRFTPEVRARIASNADSGLAVTDEPTALGLPAVNAISLADLTSDGTDDLPADWSDQLDSLPRPGGDDLYAILYTSGTTGQPRGVTQIHRTYVNAWAAILENRAFRAVMKFLMPKDGRVISVMPMSHTMGFTEFLTSLIMGSQCVFPYMPSPRGLLDAMRRNRPTYIGAAPRLLELLWAQLRREIAAHGGLAEFDARRARARRRPYWMRRRMFRSEREMLGGQLRSIGAGAAALAPDVQEAWESIGIPVIQGYGATEAGGIATNSAFRHPPGKVGKPSRAQKVELAADGEVLVSGPMVAAGYWRDPEATNLAFDGQGRYHTGDIGRIDEKGELVLIGRKKNVIVLSNGLKVYPEDIERSLHAAGLGDTVVLETMPGRIEAVVLGPERQASAAAAPLSAQEQEVIAARIDAAIREANGNLLADERVDGWRLWPEADFPRTHTMKIQRDPVRQWAIRGRDGAAVAPDPV
ncbi:MAG TPA: AMP-binding protein [Candidatus Limnocylindria bacterium]|nr:AMP-binding protein [Candidatus Limnocylindria bacterium]